MLDKPLNSVSIVSRTTRLAPRSTSQRAVSSPTAEGILGTDPLGVREWSIALAVGSAGLIGSVVMTVVEGWRDTRTPRAAQPALGDRT